MAEKNVQSENPIYSNLFKNNDSSLRHWFCNPPSARKRKTYSVVEHFRMVLEGYSGCYFNDIINLRCCLDHLQFLGCTIFYHACEVSFISWLNSPSQFLSH